MENDFLRDLGYLGVTARIKRLSDHFFYSIRELYQSQQVNIEPSWHLVFLLLNDRKPRTMVDIARTLHLTQPAMTKMIKKMVQKGYIVIVNNASDNRQKLLQLSPKAQEEYLQFERIWAAGQKAMQEMLGDHPVFLEGLDHLEQENSIQNFKDRALKYLDPGPE